MLDDAKTWTSQAQEKRKPLQPEQLAKAAEAGLFAASVLMAKCCPPRFPNYYSGAETLRNEFADWHARMEVLVGSDLHAEDETPEIDSDEDVPDDCTLASNIVDAAAAVADYHDAPGSSDVPSLAAASSSTETAVGVCVVPGSRATQTPPVPGAVPGSRAAPTTPALDAVPGSRAVSEPLVAVGAPARSTAVRTMRETMKLIGGEDPLPDIVDQMVKYNKEVRNAFQFGPKFSVWIC